MRIDICPHHTHVRYIHGLGISSYHTQLYITLTVIDTSRYYSLWYSIQLQVYYGITAYVIGISSYHSLCDILHNQISASPYMIYLWHRYQPISHSVTKYNDGTWMGLICQFILWCSFQYQKALLVYMPGIWRKHFQNVQEYITCCAFLAAKC